MKKIMFEESNVIHEVREEEMENIAAGWGMGLCVIFGAACTSDDYEGLGAEIGFCYFFGAVL